MMKLNTSTVSFMCAREKKKLKNKTDHVYDFWVFAHPCFHTWVRGPSGSSELIRCVWLKNASRHMTVAVCLDAFSPRFMQSESHLFASCLPNNDKIVSRRGTKASAVGGNKPTSVSRRVLSDWYFSLICLNSFQKSLPPPLAQTDHHPTNVPLLYQPPFPTFS